MRELYVKDILEVTKGEIITGSLELKCENFSKDTRKIKENDVYIGIKGKSFDGNEFWEEALKKGAKCVIIEKIKITEEQKQKYKDKTIIIVESTLEALYKIARLKREKYNIPVIAITGSVGKTSTKDIIAKVVSQKYLTLKTEGNNNNNIGLPFTILKLKQHEALVVEMGMNHFGEMSLLTSIAKPNICIITNIGTSHIGNLGSRENILKAKLEILEGTKDPVIILNNDNDLLHNWYKENRNKLNIKTYGIKNKSDYNAEEIQLNGDSSKYICEINGKKEEIKVPVGGEHFILNSLCAIAVGTELKIDSKDIIKGIEKMELTQKRMDIKQLKNGIKVINDAYNASFESMKATLVYLSEFKNNRKIAVLGDMFELGEYSEELHRKVGREVVKNKIDILICNGENSKNIAKESMNMGMKNIYQFETKQEVLEFLRRNVKEGDIVLFKASNGMKFFELANEIEKEEFWDNN